MAIAFARARYLSRSTGGNACRSASYNAREAITDLRTGERYSFAHRDAPEHHAVLLPEGADVSALGTAAALWNVAEGAERRRDAQVAREIVLALPADREISPEDRIELARSFAEAHFVSRGLAVQLDVHAPHAGDGGEARAVGSTGESAVGDSVGNVVPGPDGSSALYSFPYKTDVKSLVWYVPDNFEDAGYEVPATMEDLKALTEKIVADGGTPWCIGLGSDAATGWPATDWVEDLMLRNNAPEDYDAWVANTLPFNDPKVIAAIDDFGWFAKNDTFVAGGAGAVGSTDFRDSPKGLFDSPPKCYMHRQASFIPSFFPEGTEIGKDADFFSFYRSMQAYEQGLKSQDTRLVISPNSDFFRYFRTIPTPGSLGGKPGGTHAQKAHGPGQEGIQAGPYGHGAQLVGVGQVADDHAVHQRHQRYRNIRQNHRRGQGPDTAVSGTVTPVGE